MTIINNPIVNQVANSSYLANLPTLGRKMTDLGVKKNQCWLHWGVFFGIAPSSWYWHDGFWLDWGCSKSLSTCELCNNLFVRK